MGKLQQCRTIQDPIYLYTTDKIYYVLHEQLTTYIMCTEITDEDDEGKVFDICNNVGVTIAEKTA